MHNPRSVWSILRCPLVSLALASRGGPSRSWHISNVKLLVRGSDFATIQAQFPQMPVLTCNSAARTAGSPRRKAAKEREDGRVTCRADRLKHQGGGPLRVDGTEIQPYSAADKTSDPRGRCPMRRESTTRCSLRGAPAGGGVKDCPSSKLGARCLPIRSVTKRA